MLNSILSLYRPSYPTVLVYMLQTSEYRAGPYLRWYWRTTDFGRVAKRRQLEPTRAARWLLTALRLGVGLQVLVGAALIVSGLLDITFGTVPLGLGVLIIYPVLWAHLVIIPLVVGRLLIVGPRQRRLVKRSAEIFAKHPGVKIAVAGSYGKTTMKEILATVLAESKKVTSTPGNKNVSVSHAHFAARLKGDEDVLVIEYGEGAPGDIARFAKITQPTIGVITGVAPAHLDRYGSTEAAGRDIFQLAQHLKAKPVYVNGESLMAQQFINEQMISYSVRGVAGWRVADLKIGAYQTSFSLKKGKQSLKLVSELVGKHQVGPLAAAAVIAHELGLTKHQIEAGVAAIKPYEHRMQPYQLGGATIIDDTYNGNLEGIRAGLALLRDAPAKRRLYVTPGLVDQGAESQAVHTEIGELIAKAKPDIVVLMKNSVTDWIRAGLEKSSFHGQLIIETEPLKFYTNLVQFVAAGDTVLMQNDWTDNYN